MSFTFDARAVLAEIRAEGCGVAKAAKVAKAGKTLAGLAALAGVSDRAESYPSASNQPPPPDLDAFEERAAIAEHDGGLGRVEAEALAAREAGYENPAALYADTTCHWRAELVQMARDRKDEPGAAERIAAAIRFIDEGWAGRALALGWQDIEIMGLCPRDPWGCIKRIGIAWTCHPVAAITVETVTYRTYGEPLIRHRSTINTDHGAVCRLED